MQKTRMQLIPGAVLGILLLTVGTATAAETYRIQTKKTVNTVTTRTSSDEERATEREGDDVARGSRAPDGALPAATRLRHPELVLQG